MATPIPALVEPDLLIWARTSANLEPLAAARKIKVSLEELNSWESGTTRPTIANLREVGRVYKRPIAVFFLPERPKDFNTVRDFRRISVDTVLPWSAALHSEYRRAHIQHEVLLEIAELDGEPISTAWNFDAGYNNDFQIATKGRAVLQGTALLKPPARSSTEYDHMNYWTNALEEAGVLVMNTEHGAVQVSEMRAFSLLFSQVPVIMLNGSDSPRGRLFSLLHEYAHLVLRSAGICDIKTDTHAMTDERRLEARCNALAAEMLMPTADVLQILAVRDHDRSSPWDLGTLLDVARNFGVSAEAMLRRLVTVGHASLQEYQSFRARAAPEEKSTSGKGNFYNTKVRDLGKGYVRKVSGALRQALIDSTTAATFLDVKVGQISKLAKVARLP